MFGLSPELDLLMRILILAPLCLIIVIVVVRVVGLRSFSKMTAFDFVATVATGSLLAGAAQSTQWTGFIQASGAIASVLLFQAAIAKFRKQSRAFANILENHPLLLIHNGIWLEDNLKKSRVAKDDVWGKLREANATQLSKVQAVILEATGDISVLHGSQLDPELLTGVSKNER